MTTSSGAHRLYAPRRPLATPENGSDARDELLRTERLDDVVVGPELEPHDPIALVSARSEHHDRRVAENAGAPA
jgi:hypothetical protein